MGQNVAISDSMEQTQKIEQVFKEYKGENCGTLVEKDVEIRVPVRYRGTETKPPY